MSKVAAVVIDKWKLSIFKKHLDDAKYTYTQHLGISSDSLTLRVEYEWAAALQQITEAANTECAQTKVGEAG